VDQKPKNTNDCAIICRVVQSEFFLLLPEGNYSELHIMERN